MRGLFLKRGGIYYADLGKGIGSEIEKLRPVVLISNCIANDLANKNKSDIVTVIPISTRKFKGQPTQILLSKDMLEMGSNSIFGVVQTEQIRCISKKRIRSKVGDLTENTILQIENAIKISLGIEKIA